MLGPLLKTLSLLQANLYYITPLTARMLLGPNILYMLGPCINAAMQKAN